MKSYVLDELEHQWSGFLVDLNAKDLLPLFEQLGLKAKLTAYGDDPETVHEGWEQCRTVVTANEADFIRYTLDHQKRDSGTTCQDCWGLLVVPASAIARERLLPKMKNGIQVDGRTIPWAAVGYANLCVSLHINGSIGVRRFRRCVHCERDTPIHAEWYKLLPELGSRPKTNRKHE